MDNSGNGQGQGFVSSVANASRSNERALQSAGAQQTDGSRRPLSAVIHDLNNALAGIGLPAELLALSSPPDAPTHAHAEEIMDAVVRAKTLVSELESAVQPAGAPRVNCPNTGGQND